MHTNSHIALAIAEIPLIFEVVDNCLVAQRFFEVVDIFKNSDRVYRTHCVIRKVTWAKKELWM
jgi:hypothetical protein